MKVAIVAYIFLAFWTCVAGANEEDFKEQLNLRPLHDGRVLARFSFTTTLRNAVPRSPSSLKEDDLPQHYTMFPLGLSQILREYAVSELHLTLNAGQWDYARWGYPLEEGVGTGAELWAWMGDDETVTVDERWQGLRNALAGLFCASLGALDHHRTTSPVHAFRPEGALPRFSLPHKLRHASLPSEHVCTENLTPFLKQLPCKSAFGIASLLNPHKLFDADWHGMGVHVLWNRTEGVIVKLTFQAVLDPIRASHERRRDWSFGSLFDRVIKKSCPAASQSYIEVDLPRDDSHSVSPEPTYRDPIQDFVRYHLGQEPQDLDIHMSWPSETSFAYPLEPPPRPLTALSIMRSLTGPTQSQGQLSLSITNNLPVEIQAIYLETMPWLVQFYLHTLAVTVNGESRDELVSRLSYIPPVAHGRPMLFEPLLTLPAESTVHLTMEVTKSFLRYTEHQPDAQRGWDLPPAVLVPFPPVNSNQSHHLAVGAAEHPAQAPQFSLQRIYTPVLLVDLATPDFSMPYNVIIMTSTLVALGFGSLFNLLTRKFVVVKLSEAGSSRQTGVAPETSTTSAGHANVHKVNADTQASAKNATK